MNRRIVVAALIGSAVVAVGAANSHSTPAAAHSEAVDIEVAAGSEAVVDIEIQHGCFDDGELDGLDDAALSAAATVIVEVGVPAGTTLVAAEPAPGWDPSEISGSPAIARWDGGPQPADEPFGLGVRLIAPDEPGTRVVLPVVQTCVGGSELAWLDENPEAPRPAPFFVVIEPTAETQPVTTSEPEPATSTEAEPVTTSEPEPATSTEPEPVTTSEPEPAATTTTEIESAPTTAAAAEAATVAETPDETGGNSTVVATVVLIVVVGGAGAAVWSRRRASA